jgi:chromosome segregation ATPase
MKTLTPEVSGLLDKLYNLRGEDSVILVEMEKQKNKAEETKERTTNEKKNLQQKISELEKLHEELDEQGEKLKEVLSGINRDDYKTVLDRLRIDFNPKALVDKLDHSLPKTIDTVKDDTKKAEDELVKVEEEMNNAITTIEELGIRKDAALSNQEKLNEYFELALTGRINITRDSITSLLEQFSFTEEEQREAAKLLMFPEDALFTYDEKVRSKEKTGKSIGEVIAEAKTASIEESQDLETKIEFENPVQEEIVEETKYDPKDEMIATLQKAGMDYLDFNPKEIDELLANFDANIVQDNIELMNKKGLGLDIFNGHIALMYDNELEEKMEMLINNGKELNDLYLNPSVLVKYDKDALKNRINEIKSNGLDLKEVPLMAY